MKLTATGYFGREKQYWVPKWMRKVLGEGSFTLWNMLFGMIQTILALDCQKMCSNLMIILMFVLDLILTSYISPASCCHRGEKWAISLMQDGISCFISHNVPNATPYCLGYLKSCAMLYKTVQLNSSLLQCLKWCFWKLELIEAQHQLVGLALQKHLQHQTQALVFQFGGYQKVEPHIGTTCISSVENENRVIGIFISKCLKFQLITTYCRSDLKFF